MLRTVAVSPQRPPDARPPVPSITREVSAPEQAPLVDATRPPEEVTTASIGGAEMDALLASERSQLSETARNVIATNTPSAQAAAVMTRERPDVAFPSVTSEATVVLAPELTAPPAQASAWVAPPAGVLPPAGPGAEPPVAVPLAAKVPVIPVFEPPPPSRTGILFVLGGATLLAVALGAVLFGVRKGDPPAQAEAAQGSAPAASPPPAATAPTSVSAPQGRTTAPAGATAKAAPASPSAAPPGSPEAEARAALERLRDGVAKCVRDVIGVLPGTSPAVPAAFSLLRRGTYKTASGDYRSPVFACVDYRPIGPQRFQIQWQMVSHPGEGRGVAWIDTDGDKKADRAFGFRAALVRKNEVDLGEIGPLDPMPQVMKAP